MNESILQSIKKLLGIVPEYTAFDEDIIMNINSVFSVLAQLGISGAQGFKITNEEAVWGDVIDESYDMEMIKTYIFMKVKLMFDPPLNSSVLQSYKEQIQELEWRLNIECDETLKLDEE